MKKTSLLIFVTATLVPSAASQMSDPDRRIYNKDVEMFKRIDYKTNEGRVIGIVEEYEQMMMRNSEQRIDPNLPRIGK